MSRACRPNQTAIYYLTAEDAARPRQARSLRASRRATSRCCCSPDPINSFWVRTALGYEGKPFKSVTQGTADLDRISVTWPRADARARVDRTATATLAAAMKQSLGEAVKEVRISTRLTDSPVCLIADAAGLDRTLERCFPAKVRRRRQRSARRFSRSIPRIR